MDAAEKFLTVEEVSRLLRVGRSTVFDWMKKGLLKAGVHYVRIGNTVRFPSGERLTEALLASSEQGQATNAAPGPEAPAATPRAGRSKPRAAGASRLAVNLDYR